MSNFEALQRRNTKSKRKMIEDYHKLIANISLK